MMDIYYKTKGVARSFIIYIPSIKNYYYYYLYDF
nr:MAG TPA: hypothetical protein [Caudoviricetes sp.]